MRINAHNLLFHFCRPHHGSSPRTHKCQTYNCHTSPRVPNLHFVYPSRVTNGFISHPVHTTQPEVAPRPWLPASANTARHSSAALCTRVSCCRDCRTRLPGVPSTTCRAWQPAQSRNDHMPSSGAHSRCLAVCLACSARCTRLVSHSTRARVTAVAPCAEGYQ